MFVSLRKALERAATAVLLIAGAAQLIAAQPTPGKTVPLASGWEIQTSAKVQAPGEQVSVVGYRHTGWIPASVPSTVVAALVKAGIYADPTFGTNLRQYPGMNYPQGENFSKLPMAPSSPFAVPWWYRKEFNLPAHVKDQTLWLNLNGLNYRANLWINGHKVADTTQIAGAWRRYSLNVSGYVHPGRNALAIEVFAPTEHDLAITFADWNPMPPDKEMGLFGDANLETTGPVALRHTAAIAQVNSPANDQADLTVTAEVENSSARAVKGTLEGQIEGVTFSQQVQLAAGEKREVRFDPKQYSQLHFRNPRLWWPKQMGRPELYKLHLQFTVNQKISDASDSEFGIRQIASEVTSPTRRLFRINGKPLLIRGGGWAMDILMRENPVRLNDELNYVQDMGLNTIRLEGRPETEQFFHEADRRGILVMMGWSCCDFWEQWPKWTPEDHTIAEASLRSQIARLRAHPSLLMWLNGSDNPPPADVEQVYLGVEKELLWPNPILSSATAKLGGNGAMNGVRMTGPYAWVPPSYWTEDSEADQPGHKCDLGGCGGAHGFNTETSPGAAVPPVESLTRMLGKDHLWPRNDVWSFHAGGGVFSTVDHFSDALTARYGAAVDVQDYSEKSQLMTYEGIRAMYEAFSRNKYDSTGVIQWMLNNSWPSLIWHLYDYYLRPAGGYFGAKTALQPLDPVYGYDDHSVWVVSSQYTGVQGLTLKADVYDLNMKQRFSRAVPLDVAADSTTKIFALPDIPNLTPVYFLKLQLVNREGRTVGSNFYWVSTKPDIIDWSTSRWYVTGTSQSADFTALAQLPKVRLLASSHSRRDGEEEQTTVTLRNPSKSLAFFVRLKLDAGRDGDEVLPVLWQDNYVSLLPGETRTISARYAAPGLKGAQPVVSLSGWNVDPEQASSGPEQTRAEASGKGSE